jgi:hypothetical protein
METPLSTLNIIVGREAGVRLEKTLDIILIIGKKQMGMRAWVLVFSMMLSR